MPRHVHLSVVRTSSKTTCEWSQDEYLRQVLKVALETLKTPAAAMVHKRDVTIAYLEGVMTQLGAGSPAALRGALLLVFNDLEHVRGASGVRASVRSVAFRIFGASLEPGSLRNIMQPQCLQK